MLTKKQVIEAAKELDIADQNDVVDELILHLGSRPLSTSWQAEIERRAQAFNANPESGVTLERLDQNIRAKYIK